jgi:hypothetical protein
MKYQVMTAVRGHDIESAVCGCRLPVDPNLVSLNYSVLLAETQ